MFCSSSPEEGIRSSIMLPTFTQYEMIQHQEYRTVNLVVAPIDLVHRGQNLKCIKLWFYLFLYGHETEIEDNLLQNDANVTQIIRALL
jgi:hypothetical protein